MHYPWDATKAVWWYLLLAAFPVNTFNMLQGTVYECRPNGIIKVLQAYCDPNVSLSSWTLLVKVMHGASIAWTACANHTQPYCLSRQTSVNSIEQTQKKQKPKTTLHMAVLLVT